MRMKAKTYGINFLVASSLQLNIFNYELLATKNIIPYFDLHLNFYKLCN